MHAFVNMVNMINIVLIQPEHPGNVGAVARVMANFGLDKLVLVEPLCDKDSSEAIKRAKHALPILKKAKVVKKEYLDRFDYLIGTTAKLGTDYNIPRSPITPKQLAEKLSCNEEVSGMNEKKMSEMNLKKISRININNSSVINTKKTALIFGREGIGLTNDEINACDFIVSIPSFRKYPTLNISHACAILFYELFQALGEKETKTNAMITPASEKDKEVMMMRINQVLDKLEFTTPEKKETQKIVWRRLIGKSMMTKREAFAAIGLWRKISEKL